MKFKSTPRGTDLIDLNRNHISLGVTSGARVDGVSSGRQRSSPSAGRPRIPDRAGRVLRATWIRGRDKRTPSPPLTHLTKVSETAFLLRENSRGSRVHNIAVSWKAPTPSDANSFSQQLAILARDRDSGRLYLVCAQRAQFAGSLFAPATL